jgi:sulfoxide reductase catalytic subunit YedY
MLIRRPRPGDSAAIRPSEITPENVYLDRRRLLQAALAAGVAGLGGAWSQAAPADVAPLQYKRNDKYSLSEAQNSYEDITSYNNFYEFGIDKGAPAANSGRFKPAPWSVAVSGECESKGTFALEDILKGHALEERVYRLRCVEAWSMVIPWIGYPLSALIKRAEPTANAKYVQFVTLDDPKQFPGQRGLLQVLDWPYVEGLRMDEAMHPLAILCVGLYGKVLPNPNGAPVRMVVPWKYGFKGGKSLVKIRFVEEQPQTTWNKAGPNEYGFYSNVNPHVDHPRWSQATERRIGEFFRRKTLMFNGYGEQVAQLYTGMDLRKYF